jgi:hypothetical protein
MFRKTGIGLLLATLAMPLWAAPRVALVIGNSDYRGVGDSLKNPVNDAEDMAARLKALGYDTLLVRNAGREAFWQALETFQGKLEPRGTAVIYYAGHGLQVDGRNYLVPVDASMKSRLRVDIESIPVQKVVDLLQESGTSGNLLILDACRNDPFPKEFRAMGQRGLTRMKEDVSSERTMILYSASPGQVAQDGRGRNGVFTGELLKLMDIPGLALPQMYVRLKTAVREASEGRTQQIYQEGDILADFIFQPGSTVTVASTAAPSVNLAPVALSQESDESLLASGQWRDPKTNMIWMRCSLGQVWNGSTCTGYANQYTWEDANRAVVDFNFEGGFEGHRDWQLPHIEDLATLINCSGGYMNTYDIPGKYGGTKTIKEKCKGQNDNFASMDYLIFPNTPIYKYWASTLYDGDNRQSWFVNFGNGFTGNYAKSKTGKDENYHVRMVRAGR